MEEHKRFICDFENCKYETNNSSHFANHKRTHMGDAGKIYSCDFDGCTFSCVNKSNLSTHIKSVHNNEKRYICDFENCTYSCFALKDMIVHTRIHTGTKPYACDFINCDLKFTQPQHLESHKRIHTSEHPYACEFSNCKYTCSSSTTMRSHIFTHTKEKPFTCDYSNCDFKTARSSSLKAHKTNMHTKEGIQRQKKSENFTFKFLQKQLDIEREHQIDFKSCGIGTFSRIDGVTIQNGILFFIENDENQHKFNVLSCETKRMMDIKCALIQDGNDMPLVFIRFNPDKFTINDKRVYIPKKDRLKKCADLIKTISINKDTLMTLNIYYMYYNVTDNNLNILSDPDFPEEMKPCVKVITQ